MDAWEHITRHPIKITNLSSLITDNDDENETLLSLSCAFFVFGDWPDSKASIVTIFSRSRSDYCNKYIHQEWTLLNRSVVSSLIGKTGVNFILDQMRVEGGKKSGDLISDFTERERSTSSTSRLTHFFRLIGNWKMAIDTFSKHVYSSDSKCDQWRVFFAHRRTVDTVAVN